MALILSDTHESSYTLLKVVIAVILFLLMLLAFALFLFAGWFWMTWKALGLFHRFVMPTICYEGILYQDESISCSWCSLMVLEICLWLTSHNHSTKVRTISKPSCPVAVGIAYIFIGLEAEEVVSSRIERVVTRLYFVHHLRRLLVELILLNREKSHWIQTIP